MELSIPSLLLAEKSSRSIGASSSINAINPEAGDVVPNLLAARDGFFGEGFQVNPSSAFCPIKRSICRKGRKPTISIIEHKSDTTTLPSCSIRSLSHLRIVRGDPIDNSSPLTCQDSQDSVDVSSDDNEVLPTWSSRSDEYYFTHPVDVDRSTDIAQMSENEYSPASQGQYEESSSVRTPLEELEIDEFAYHNLMVPSLLMHNTPRRDTFLS